MSSQNDVPMWLREQLARFEQLQQNLQSILMQKQQVDLESADVDKAVSELKKAGEEDTVVQEHGNNSHQSKEG